MTPPEEKKGRALFKAMLEEAGKLSLLELLTLRSAYNGRADWEDLPDRVRAAFVRIAGR